jgi:hypothetical protein
MFEGDDMLESALSPRAMEIRRHLEAAVEEHLPGDFSSWEEENSRWVGNLKTLDATRRDPRAATAAFAIYTAYELGEQIFGFADRARDEAALRKMRAGVDLIEAAFQEMSVYARREIGRSSYEQISGIVEAPIDGILPAVLETLKSGTTAALKMTAEKGTPTSRQNRRAAAVFAECRAIYAARTGRPAPDTVRNADRDTNWAPPEETQLVRFVSTVFSILAITVRVDSAARVWRDLCKHL